MKFAKVIMCGNQIQTSLSCVTRKDLDLICDLYSKVIEYQSYQIFLFVNWYYISNLNKHAYDFRLTAVGWTIYCMKVVSEAVVVSKCWFG